MRTHGEGAGKHGKNLVGGGGSGDIVVLGLATKEAIADAAAGEEGSVASGLELFDDGTSGLLGLGQCGHSLV